MVDNKIQKRSGNPILRFINHLVRSIQGLFQSKKKSIGASWQNIKLEISPKIKHYLEMRHVSEDEAKQVIYQAETTKEKIFQPSSERFLAKLRIGKATFYVEYHQGTDSFVIDSAYAHKSEIIG